MAEQFKVPFLGEIPLVKEIRTDGDNGTPLLVANPTHLQSQAFLRIAEQVVMRLEEKARRQLSIH